MDLRTFAACALALVPALVACSGGDAVSGSSPATTSAGGGTSEPVLDGHYVATTRDGDFTDITFDDNTSYVAWRTSCDPSTASCFDVGTYALGDDDTSITLKDEATGKSTTYPFKSIEAAPSGEPSASTTTASLHVETALTGDAGTLTRSGSALTTSTIQQATVAGHPIKLVATSAKLVSSSNDNCTMSLPISGDPSTFYAQAKKQIQAKGGTVSGNTTSGSFSVPGPLGSVDGTYKVVGANVQMTIAPDSLGFVQTCQRVYDALKSALGG